jgi:pyruvate formate lyase activating enzyme
MASSFHNEPERVKKAGRRDIEKAIVTNIQGYSIHDGPGIRTVVFLKGCPLRCAWCANPENLVSRVQVGFISRLCQGCGRCAAACRHGAIIPGYAYRINQEKCTACGECVARCYYDALVRYGTERTSREVFEEVRRDKMFYDTSGGGVTVSGGEPMTRHEFVYELFSLCKEDGISTCVETCGFAPRAAFERILPVTDLFLFDLKAMDPALHEKFTGCGNAPILDNARYLADEGADILFRQPLVPGYTDAEENIRRTAEFILSLGGGYAIELMPFHRAGAPKYAALGLPYEAEHLTPLTEAQIARARELYLDCGVRCTVSK